MWRPYVFIILLLSIWVFPGRAQESEIDAAQIVRRHVEARGGAEALRRVETVRQRGHLSLNGQLYPVTIYFKRPGRYRFEMSLPDGKTAVAAWDGETGWMDNILTWRMGIPKMDRSPLLKIPTDEALRRLVEDDGDFFGPLADYQAKGHQVELMDSTEVDGTPVYHLQVTLKSGRVQHWYLDQDTATVVKKKTPQLDVFMGSYERIWYYDDYRQVAGILFPFFSEREDVQFIRDFEIDEIEVNGKLDDTLFTLPPARKGSLIRPPEPGETPFFYLW